MTSLDPRLQEARPRGALLGQASIRALREAAITSGIVSNRGGLLAGINASLVASLKVADSPAGQLGLDLDTLNGAARLRDGTVPLLLWLANAESLAGQRMEAEIFARAHEEVLRRTTADP